MLALREGLCGFQEESEQGKQGGTAESNFTDPVLVDEHTGTGSFFIAKTRPARGAGLFI